MKGIFVSAILLSSLLLSGHAYAARCNMLPQGGGEVKKTNMQGDNVQSSSNHNSGLYAWSHGNTWVLEETFFDPNVSSRSPNSEDYVETYSGTNGSSSNSATIDASICDIPTLPTVKVIAPYSGGVSQYVVSSDRGPTSGGGGGGFLRIFRSPNPFKGNKQADDSLKCGNSDDETRMLAARDIISTTTSPFNRRGIYNIQYGPGTSQRWSVTEPYATTLGLLPAGECKGP